MFVLFIDFDFFFFIFGMWLCFMVCVFFWSVSYTIIVFYYAPLALTGIEPAYLVCEPTSCRFRWQSHVGAGEGAWTPDLMITNQLLYQLSYTSTHAYLKRTIKYLNGIADPLRLISCFVHSNILLFTYLSPKVSYIDPWWCRCSGRITQHWTHGDLFLLR